MSGSQPARGALTIRGLVKRFHGVTAVDDLTIELEAGEFFTLLGPSGCGKSTTLMCAVGLETPDAGQILIDGVDMTRLPPERRGMGVVFQSYALFPHMSVLDNVMFPLLMHGQDRKHAAARAHEALALVELERLATAKPTTISGGQAQRVALARALVFEPAVLLMDEPLAALDRRLRETLQFELRHLRQRIGTTVLYVTHDQDEALALSDRIGVMRNGKFEQIGTPGQVYQHPATAFVANFLGDSNWLPVTVVVGSDDGGQLIAQDDEGHCFRAVGDLREGQHGLLVVRPEHVELEADGGPDQVDGTDARVTDVAFMGDHVRVELRVGGSIWTLRRPAADLAAMASARDTIVRVVWPAWQAIVLVGDGGDGAGDAARFVVPPTRD